MELLSLALSNYRLLPNGWEKQVESLLTTLDSQKAFSQDKLESVDLGYYLMNILKLIECSSIQINQNDATITITQKIFASLLKFLPDSFTDTNGIPLIAIICLIECAFPHKNYVLSKEFIQRANALCLMKETIGNLINIAMIWSPTTRTFRNLLFKLINRGCDTNEVFTANVILVIQKLSKCHKEITISSLSLELLQPKNKISPLFFSLIAGFTSSLHILLEFGASIFTV